MCCYIHIEFIELRVRQQPVNLKEDFLIDRSKHKSCFSSGSFFISKICVTIHVSTKFSSFFDDDLLMKSSYIYMCEDLHASVRVHTTRISITGAYIQVYKAQHLCKH